MLKTEASGRRKPEAQARDGGMDPGQPRFEGRVVKELVEPVSRTEAATYVAARCGIANAMLAGWWESHGRVIDTRGEADSEASACEIGYGSRRWSGRGSAIGG